MAEPPGWALTTRHTLTELLRVSAVWDVPELCVAVPAPTHVEPHVERVTMHPRVLAAARAVLVLAAGTSKADVLGRALAGGNVRELPVRATMTPNATWLLDEAAAARLW